MAPPAVKEENYHSLVEESPNSPTKIGLREESVLFGSRQFRTHRSCSDAALVAFLPPAEQNLFIFGVLLYFYQFLYDACI